MPLSEACNVGIEQANGEYIVRLDADDWVDQEFLKTELDHLKSNPDLDAVWCDYVRAYELTAKDDFVIHNLAYSGNDDLEHACGVMFKRSVWEELDGYDENLKYQESFDFWQRFNRAGYKAERLKKPLYIYRRGHESMSSNPERLAVRRELEIKYGYH